MTSPPTMIVPAFWLTLPTPLSTPSRMLPTTVIPPEKNEIELVLRTLSVPWVLDRPSTRSVPTSSEPWLTIWIVPPFHALAAVTAPIALVLMRDRPPLLTIAWSDGPGTACGFQFPKLAQFPLPTFQNRSAARAPGAGSRKAPSAANTTSSGEDLMRPPVRTLPQ